ncbi:MAG: FG-GAP-like repeat-containing protein [Acidobacteriaceae bacterium]
MRFFRGGSVVHRTLSQSWIRFWVLSLGLAALPVAGTAVAHAQSQSREGAFVYAAVSGFSPQQLINGYAINPATGALSPVPGTPFDAGALVQAIVAHPSGKFVYAVIGNGSVVAFTVDSFAGTLSPVWGSPFAAGVQENYGGNLAAIDPAGKYLYVADNSGVYAFSIDSGSGALTPVTGSPFLSVSAGGVTVDPSGQYLVVLTVNNTQVYSIDRSTGGLTPVNGLVSGCDGGWMTFEPTGHFLYASRNYGIAVCSFNSTSGVLTPLSSSPFYSATPFEGIAMHPSGSFLYASSTGPCENSLYGFVLDPSTGTLAAIPGSPFGNGQECYADWDVASEASGNFVYAVDNQHGISAYAVNQSTGALTPASNSLYGPGSEALTTVPNAIASTATLTGLAITPATPQIGTNTLGQQIQLTLQATFSDGSTGFLTESATWTSSNQNVATIAAGLATSTGYGTTMITATVNGISAMAQLDVTTTVLSSITIAPASFAIYQGTALQLTATGYYSDGTSADLTDAAVWTSSNNAIAAVSTTGLAQSVDLGTVTITATDGISGATSLTVLKPIESCTTPNPNPNPNPESFAAPGDFNRDCRSDILWRNTSTQQVYEWLMDGPTYSGSGSPGSPTSDWVIQGTGDFNDDGHADILWRNSSTGEVYIWLMNGTSIVDNVSLGYVSSDWSIAGIGDFNGDGMADILWWNSSTGQVYLWLLNGTTVSGGGSISYVSSGWTIQGVGDFNDDGDADILWRNSSTGEVYVWLMNGTTLTSSGSLGSVTSDWVVQGLGDFDGNGTSDILWRNSNTGQVYLWFMNGTAMAGSGSLGYVSSDWAIEGEGDYDGSGRAGILWRNSSTEQVYIWLMNGTTLESTGSPGAPDVTWQIQP